MTATRAMHALIVVSSVTLAAGCGGGDRDQQAPAAQAPPASAAQAPSESSRQLLSWLPGGDAVPGWTRTVEPKRYGQGNLWEYIDGAAETYLTFNFQEAATAGYANRERNLEATVDIYRMADPVGAYGVYAEERNPSATPVAVGAEGHRSGNALSFWAGPCYVKLTAPTEGPAVAAGLEALAADVARRIGQAGSRPAVFDRFPAASLVPHSFRVLPKDVLAQSYLSNGFQAEYKDGTASWKLVLVALDDEAAASAALERYRSFLASSGGTAPRALPAPGSGGFAGQDSYYGLVVAARTGRELGIAVGAPSERQATAQLSALLKR